MGKKVKLGFIAKIAKRILVPLIQRKLKDEAIRAKLVDAVNKRINLPKMTEEEERKLFTQLYDALVDAVGAVIDDL